jgi:hypothetical protein
MLILDSFQKITNFADFSFLKFKIDLELNLSKSDFADFILILEFDSFLPKSIKYKKTQKQYKRLTINKTKRSTYVN